jgi:hypothetical protein
VGLTQDIAGAVLGDGVDRLLVVAPLQVAMLLGQFGGRLERLGDEQVDRLVDGVPVRLEHVVVILAEAVDEPEILDSGLFCHLADGRLL